MRGLGEGSVAMATSSPRDPRSSLPGLVEKGGPGRPPGRLGWARSPNVTRYKGTQGCPSDAMGSRANATKRVAAAVGGRGKRGGRGGGRGGGGDGGGETAAAQDGRRRDTHHVNNTLLQRKPTPSRPAPTSGYPPRIAGAPSSSFIARPHSRLS